MRTNLGRTGILGLLAVFVLASVAIGADTEKQPKILVEEIRHDFGKIYERKVYRHAFKVKNAGTADLIIERVKPG